LKHLQQFSLISPNKIEKIDGYVEERTPGDVSRKLKH